MLNSWVKDPYVSKWQFNSFYVVYCNPCNLCLLICKMDLSLYIICRCPSIIRRPPRLPEGFEFYFLHMSAFPNSIGIKMFRIFSRIHVFSIIVNNGILDRKCILCPIIMCISLNHLYTLYGWVCTDSNSTERANLRLGMNEPGHWRPSGTHVPCKSRC